jgi:7tm Odorant receptor
MFLVVIVHYVVASVYRLCLLNNYNEILLPILHTIFSINLLLKIISFKWNESEIIDIMKSFEKLEAKMNKLPVLERHIGIRKFTRVFLMMDVTVVLSLASSIFIFSKENNFILPRLYQPSNIYEYYVLFALSVPHTLIAGTSLTAVESIFNVSLMMLEMQVSSVKEIIVTAGKINKDSMRRIVELQTEVQRFVVLTFFNKIVL